MSDRADSVAESRQSPRVKLPAMYTLIRVRPQGQERYCWTGHIYDISETGIRFELDRALKPGSTIDFRAMLPGPYHVTVNLSGKVVRLHDDDELPGPSRMGAEIDQANSPVERQKLSEYLDHSLELAPA